LVGKGTKKSLVSRWKWTQTTGKHARKIVFPYTKHRVSISLFLFKIVIIITKLTKTKETTKKKWGKKMLEAKKLNFEFKKKQK